MGPRVGGQPQGVEAAGEDWWVPVLHAAKLVGSKQHEQTPHFPVLQHMQLTAGRWCVL